MASRAISPNNGQRNGCASWPGEQVARECISPCCSDTHFSVRWLLSNTKASSICALDWCPIVNAAASALHMAHSLVSSSAVSITAPGHVLLLGEHFDSPAFDFIIDTNVAVFNLDYPPLFPEKLRELPQVKQHLRCICKLLRRGGVATLLCRNAEILDVVMCDLQSTSLEVVHSIRCLGSKQESTMTLKDQVSLGLCNAYTYFDCI